MARPTGVTILAVLGFLCAAFALLAALGMFLAGSMGLATMSRGGAPIAGMLGAFGALAGVVLLIFAALYVICGVGLLKLANWGRLLTIILVALGALFAVMGFLKAMMPFQVVLMMWELIVISIDVWILLYLFKPHVKQAFGVS